MTVKQFAKGAEKDLVFPLSEIPEDLGKSQLVSPRIGKHNGLKPPPAVGSEEFYESLLEVISVRKLVQKGEWPTEFLRLHGIDPEVPEPLQGHVQNNPKNAAHLVHMDKPIDLYDVLTEYLEDQEDPERRDGRKHKEFIGRVASDQALMMTDIEQALEAAFDAKYYYGHPRPEECVSEGVDFTHYKEGCPCHPSYPAGHGAVSGATYLRLTQEWNMTGVVSKVILQSCLHWSMYRTFAGVHYAYENLAGFWLGCKGAVYKDRFRL